MVGVATVEELKPLIRERVLKEAMTLCVVGMIVRVDLILDFTKDGKTDIHAGSNDAGSCYLTLRHMISYTSRWRSVKI